MTSKLGKGLDALIPGGYEEKPSSDFSNEVNIGLIDINPHQPRRDFDDVKIEELAASIKKHGILQPLVVTQKGKRYELIAGERRLRAAKIAGLKKVPIIVRDVDEHQKLELAIIENVQRKNLNPIEEAVSYKKLIDDFGFTQEKIAETVGKSRSLIANKIRLLSLPSDIRRALKDGEITEGHAKALLAIKDDKKRESLFRKIIKENLTVRDVEKSPKSTSRTSPKSKDSNLLHLEKELKNYLGTKVNIKGTINKGKIEVEYYSEEELDEIYRKICD